MLTEEYLWGLSDGMEASAAECQAAVMLTW
jgi:hypothetical protein